MYETHRWNTPELVTEGVLLSSVNNRGAAQPLASSNSGDIITLGEEGQGRERGQRLPKTSYAWD